MPDTPFIWMLMESQELCHLTNGSHQNALINIHLSQPKKKSARFLWNFFEIEIQLRQRSNKKYSFIANRRLELRRNAQFSYFFAAIFIVLNFWKLYILFIRCWIVYFLFLDRLYCLFVLCCVFCSFYFKFLFCFLFSVFLFCLIFVSSQYCCVANLKRCCIGHVKHQKVCTHVQIFQSKIVFAFSAPPFSRYRNTSNCGPFTVQNRRRLYDTPVID